MKYLQQLSRVVLCLGWQSIHNRKGEMVGKTHEFRIGDAVLFMDEERSVHEGIRTNSMVARSVTLFVDQPGEFFQVGRVPVLQKRVKRAAEAVYGISVGVVNLRSITLYDQSIRSYADAVEVATEFAASYNEQLVQLSLAKRIS